MRKWMRDRLQRRCNLSRAKGKPHLRVVLNRNSRRNPKKENLPQRTWSRVRSLVRVRRIRAVEDGGGVADVAVADADASRLWLKRLRLPQARESFRKFPSRMRKPQPKERPNPKPMRPLWRRRSPPFRPWFRLYRHAHRRE